MNPLEVLRYLAQLNDDDPRQVAMAALDSLAGLSSNPEIFYVAIKRLLLAHPRNGLLWSVSNRLLLSLDRSAEARVLHREISEDRTLDALRDEMHAGTVLFTLEMDRSFAQLNTPWRDTYGRSVRLRSKGGSSETREPLVYFDPFRSAAQLLAQAMPRASSALLLEPWSFSGGFSVMPREAVSLAQSSLGAGIRVICRVPCGFDLSPRLFETQVATLGRLENDDGRLQDDEVTDLVGLPSFRANPELVTFLIGSDGASPSNRIAGELLALK